MSAQSYVLRELSNLYPQLSKSQQKVAAYVIHQNAFAAFMTLTELAEATGVSKSTVERVARETLGYESFHSFRSELQHALRATFEPAERIQATARASGAAADILTSTFREDINNVEQTLLSIAPAAFSDVVKKLGSASRVYIFARGVSKAAATLLKERLALVRAAVSLVEQDAGGARRRLLSVEPDDLAVFIFFRAYSQETLESAEYAASRHAQLVAITVRVTSPLLKLTDTHVLLESERVSAMVSSLAPVMSVVDAMITPLIQL